jgi:site-specific recombinase XerD
MAENPAADGDEIKRFAAFLDELHERGRSPRTLRAYASDWERFAAWYAEANGEPFTLRRVTALDIEDYLTWGKKQDLKPSTLNRRLAFLKQYIVWGAQQGVIDQDQQQRIKKIAIVKKQSLAPRSLTSSEARRLLKEVQARGNTRDEAIITTLLHTGLRVGELVALTVDDVTMSARKGEIRVRAGISKGSKERVVPLPKRARETLSAYFKEHQKNTGDALFIGRQGPLSADGVAAVVAKYAEWARLEGVTPHVLRHTFAYNFLANNNNDLVALADILGHTNLNTTRIYTKRRLSDLQAGAERVSFF